MATTKFFVRSQSNTSTIYIRFTANRTINFMRSLPITINSNYFNNATGKVRNIATFKDKDKIQNQLNNLNHFVISQYNDSHAKEIYINSDWLQNQINNFFNLVKVTDLNFLENYTEHFIEKLKLKTNDKTGGLGSSKATVLKYKTIKTKIVSFQEYKKKKYRLEAIDVNFRNEFLKYLLEIDKLSRNTAGRYIKFLKTIVLDAQKSGYKVSNELAQIKGFSVYVEKIYLTFDELETIENTIFDNEKLESAKDWLLIGCNIGQRVGDFLQLTKENISFNGDLEVINLIQQKTKKRVSIPVNETVKGILAKRGGQFPMKYSNNLESAKTVFNILIKDVCEKAGLTEIIKGAMINPKTARKESGQYPKYKLITSHICRRSFATNYYGEIPTAILINVTGHGTEKEFLNYIGKTPIDYAEQMALHLNLLNQKKKKQTILRKVQ